MRIQLHTSKQGQKNQNHAEEREIGFLAKAMETPNTEEKGTKAALGFRIGGRKLNTDANGMQIGLPHRIWGGDCPNSQDQ